jgi:hypothetical protein
MGISFRVALFCQTIKMEMGMIKKPCENSSELLQAEIRFSIVGKKANKKQANKILPKTALIYLV